MKPEQLKEARQALGLSASQLADALSDPDPDGKEVHPRTVQRWESGAQAIPGPVVVAVRFMLRDAGHV